MAAAAIRGQINVLIATMFNTGLVDDAFLQLQRMREQGRETPAHVVEVMNRFLIDAERIINDISGLMINEPEVDFDKVDGLVQQLKVTCSSVGAKRLNLCCVQHFSPEAKNKEGYLEALGRVRFQFYDLRSMFKIIMEVVPYVHMLYFYYQLLTSIIIH
uniref:Histidine-containing phosphotransfer protein n=1 Tax=Triticum urartu TaxID=4572 RepID=A0A8R7U282_TRIUA